MNYIIALLICWNIYLQYQLQTSIAHTQSMVKYVSVQNIEIIDLIETYK